MLNPVSESGRDLLGYKRLLLLSFHYSMRLEGGKVFCSLLFHIEPPAYSACSQIQPEELLHIRLLQLPQEGRAE